MRKPAIASGTALSSAISSSATSTSRLLNSRRCSSPLRTRTTAWTARWRPSVPSSATLDVWGAIVRDAARESSLWRDALKSSVEEEPVFSPLGESRFALGLETSYEGYLVHYGVPRVFTP